jgi:hypothetical protein
MCLCVCMRSKYHRSRAFTLASSDSGSDAVARKREGGAAAASCRDAAVTMATPPEYTGARWPKPESASSKMGRASLPLLCECVCDTECSDDDDDDDDDDAAAASSGDVTAIDIVES